MLKKLLTIGALTLLSTAALAQQAPAAATDHDVNHTQTTQPSFKAKKLTRAEFDALIAHPDQILLIDVRRPDEIVSVGGFPVYLSIQIKDLKNHLNEIPKDKLIITVSNHAARAGVAADLLSDNGFKVAGAVGAQTYEADGGKLTKIAPTKSPVPSDATHRDSTQAAASTGN